MGCRLLPASGAAITARHTVRMAKPSRAYPQLCTPALHHVSDRAPEDITGGFSAFRSPTCQEAPGGGIPWYLPALPHCPPHPAPSTMNKAGLLAAAGVTRLFPVKGNNHHQGNLNYFLKTKRKHIHSFKHGKLNGLFFLGCVRMAVEQADTE